MITNINQLDLSKNYTYADYLTWQFSDMVELIKGKIFKMSPAPKREHQEVCGNLQYLIKSFLWKQPCKIYMAPFDVRFVNGNGVIIAITQPDLCVICDIQKLDDDGCLGAPNFIIEILSPSTRSKDIHDKFDLYEEFGVLEYWIVDPKNQIIDKFVLENKKYNLKGKYTLGDTISVFTLPGLAINLNDVFE